MEAMVYRLGVHKIPSMLDYKSHTAKDMPPVHTMLVETHDPNGPFGAKECGQGPLLPVPPAVANALYDAIGVRFDQVPIGPDDVLLAITEHARGRSDRFGPKSVPDIEWNEPIKVELPAVEEVV